MLRIIGQQLFYDIDDFAFMVGSSARDKTPPAWWKGGKCTLHTSQGRDGGLDFEGFAVGIARQFREGDRWMVVGKKPMRVVSLQFENGW